MKLGSLIGKEIVDIFVKVLSFDEFKDYGLLKAECYYVLSDNLIIGLPFQINDQDVWIKKLDPLAKSYYPTKKWWQKKQAADKIKNSRIKDIIQYAEEMQPVFIELDSGVIITEETVAPSGIGVGLRSFASIGELEERFGKDYIRLSDHKGDVQWVQL
jgi:hypothetical protein